MRNHTQSSGPLQGILLSFAPSSLSCSLAQFEGSSPILGSFLGMQEEEQDLLRKSGLAWGLPVVFVQPN